LQVIFGDNKYHNYNYYEWLAKYSQGRWRMEISSRPADAEGFQPVRIRWVVERTFAWISKHRRCVRDYETKPDHHEAMIYIAMIMNMSRRLARTGDW